MLIKALTGITGPQAISFCKGFTASCMITGVASKVLSGSYTRYWGAQISLACAVGAWKAYNSTPLSPPARLASKPLKDDELTKEFDAYLDGSKTSFDFDSCNVGRLIDLLADEPEKQIKIFQKGIRLKPAHIQYDSVKYPRLCDASVAHLLDYQENTLTELLVLYAQKEKDPRAIERVMGSLGVLIDQISMWVVNPLNMLFESSDDKADLATKLFDLCKGKQRLDSWYLQFVPMEHIAALDKARITEFVNSLRPLSFLPLLTSPHGAALRTHTPLVKLILALSHNPSAVNELAAELAARLHGVDIYALINSIASEAKKELYPYYNPDIKPESVKQNCYDLLGSLLQFESVCGCVAPYAVSYIVTKASKDCNLSVYPIPKELQKNFINLSKILHDKDQPFVATNELLVELPMFLQWVYCNTKKKERKAILGDLYKGQTYLCLDDALEWMRERKIPLHGVQPDSPAFLNALQLYKETWFKNDALDAVNVWLFYRNHNEVSRLETQTVPNVAGRLFARFYGIKDARYALSPPQFFHAFIQNCTDLNEFDKLLLSVFKDKVLRFTDTGCQLTVPNDVPALALAETFFTVLSGPVQAKIEEKGSSNNGFARLPFDVFKLIVPLLTVQTAGRLARLDRFNYHRIKRISKDVLWNFPIESIEKVIGMYYKHIRSSVNTNRRIFIDPRLSEVLQVARKPKLEWSLDNLSLARHFFHSAEPDFDIAFDKKWDEGSKLRTVLMAGGLANRNFVHFCQWAMRNWPKDEHQEVEAAKCIDFLCAEAKKARFSTYEEGLQYLPVIDPFQLLWDTPANVSASTRKTSVRHLLNASMPLNDWDCFVAFMIAVGERRHDDFAIIYEKNTLKCLDKINTGISIPKNLVQLLRKERTRWNRRLIESTGLLILERLVAVGAPRELFLKACGAFFGPAFHEDVLTDETMSRLSGGILQKAHECGFFATQLGRLSALSLLHHKKEQCLQVLPSLADCAVFENWSSYIRFVHTLSKREDLIFEEFAVAIHFMQSVLDNTPGEIKLGDEFLEIARVDDDAMQEILMKALSRADIESLKYLFRREPNPILLLGLTILGRLSNESNKTFLDACKEFFKIENPCTADIEAIRHMRSGIIQKAHDCGFFETEEGRQVAAVLRLIHLPENSELKAEFLIALELLPQNDL
ncbi:MAG: hypothetical protein ABSA17_08710 [Rhabdochlamydiaceae bacterium]